jgi:hypothetical protein
VEEGRGNLRQIYSGRGVCLLPNLFGLSGRPRQRGEDALNGCGLWRPGFTAITVGDFENLAEHCGLFASEARDTVEAFVARARAAFREIEGEYPADIAPLVRAHLDRLGL